MGLEKELIDQTPLLKFSHNIIEHLGVKLYQNKPTNVLSELVSNSWDADAEQVWVDLKSNGSRYVTVLDDGYGMSYSDIVYKYLVIGLPKRKKNEPNERSRNKKRYLMGRKGIGKLAPFGIASFISVVSVSNDELGQKRLNWFRLDLDKMKALAELEQEVSYPPDFIVKNLEYPLELSAHNHDEFYEEILSALDKINSAKSGTGTLIVLSGLSTKRSVEPDTLRAALGRRLSVSILRKDFEVKVNGLAVTKEHALPEFDFFIGTVDEPVSEEIAEGKKVSYWVGFVKSAQWPQDESGVGVYAHGKIAQDRPFTFGSKGREILTRYMYAVVDADWLDEFDDDVVSTDRTSIDWQREETKPLYDWGQRKISAWTTEFQRWKEEDGRTENLKKVKDRVRQREFKLSDPEEQAVADLLSEITPLAGNDPDLTNRAIDSLAGAWVHMPMRKMTKDLWDYFKAKSLPADEFLVFLTKLHENLVPEALSLSVTFAQRIYALTILYERIMLGTETDLQKLIEKFPWILDPEYEKLTANQWLKTTVEEAEAKGFIPKAYAADENKSFEKHRPDFVFFSPPGSQMEFRVVELKGPTDPLLMENVEQLRGYLNFIKGKYPKANISGMLIGQKADNIDAYDPRIKIENWMDILERSRKGHVDLVAAMLDGAEPSGSDVRVHQIAEFGGKETIELLERLSIHDEKLSYLMSEIKARGNK